MKKKNSLLLILCLISLFFGIKNVNAVDKKEFTEKCKDKYSEDLIKNGFNPKVTTVVKKDYTEFTYNMNPSAKYKNITMQISVSKGEILNGKTEVKGNDSFTIRVKNTKGSSNTYEDDFDVTLTSKDTEKVESLECTGTITFSLSGESYAGTKDSEPIAEIKIDIGGNQSAIDCNNPANRNEIIICEAKKRRTNKNDYIFTALNSDGSRDENAILPSRSFKCDVNNFKVDRTKLTNSEFYVSYKEYNDHLSDLYYQNRKYLYGISTEKFPNSKDKESYQYVYNYDPLNPTNGEKISCKRTCEEGVVVEYGPPVASKAGLCFEYKIRVTSAVRCYSDLNSIKTPGNPMTVCTPGPTCTGVGRHGTYHVTEGGPSKEYDKCIKSCDGGKYTKSCSNKCYKKVYGSSTKTSNNNNSASTLKLSGDSTYDKIEECISKSSKNHGGCYVRQGRSIVWKDNGRMNRGRWYVTSGWSRSGYKVFLDDGFMRHDYGGDFCHDSCSWNSNDCSSNEYLNYGYAESDYKANMKIYKKLVDRCKAAATCSTSLAEFTISVDYTNSNKKKVTIDFPYSSEADKLGTDQSNSTNKNENTTIINEPAPNGCFLTTNKNAQFYQAAWSFPGSWINNKTGEVSYKPKKTSDGWRSLPDKFCIPLDAQNVNTAWWNSYYGTQLQSFSKTSISSASAIEKCKSISEKGSIYNYKQTFTKDDIKNIDYNINGKTKKFGHFGWNISVSCFYALNTSIPKVTENSTTTDDKTPLECKTSSESRVRTVDLTNLFPSTDGTTKNSDSTTTGRTPGFNWSTYATISENKNPTYTSSPAQYLADVQKLGYSVYSNNYLDYEITLDKAKLAELKKYGNSVSGTSGSTKKDKNYTAFDGTSTVSDKTGVTRYTSNLLGSLGSNIKRPRPAARECNNMKNYDSDECQKAGETK